jgi:hypothetical protein
VVVQYWKKRAFILKRNCPANSKRGRYYAQIISAGKLEARPFFFLNFKGTPSQEEHKTIYSGLTFVRWLCLIKVTFRQFSVCVR